MNGETRNTKVVVCLILAMTAGARLLLWLEPRPTVAGSALPLTATGGASIDNVIVEYARLGEVGARGAEDLLILPDGHSEGQPDGPQVRLLVVGSGASDELATAQKEALLRTLGGLAQAASAGAVNVRLDAGSDVRQTPGLPLQARDLRQLLVRKGFIE
jgi:hypothetical protein